MQALGNSALLAGAELGAYRASGLGQLVWFCLRTHPKHEHIAAAHLRRMHDLEVFNPQLRLLRSTRRGRVWSTESLFPNYLFARFVLPVMLEKIRFTPAVKTVVQFGFRVPAIPEVAIEELRRDLERSVNEVFTDALAEGDEVEIGAGPFQGAHGRVTRVLPAAQRVQILLDIMGRLVPAELNLSSVLYRKRDVADVALRQPGLRREGQGTVLMPAARE